MGDRMCAKAGCVWMIHGIPERDLCAEHMTEDRDRLRAEAERLRGALRQAHAVVEALANHDLFGPNGNLVNAARYAEEACRSALAATPGGPNAK